MLGYLEKQLSKKERKEVVRYMSQYRNLDAIIRAKEMDLYPSRITSYEEKPSQSTRNFYSEAEAFAVKRDEIERYRKIKKRLDIAYESVKPLQREMWDLGFVDGMYDVDLQERLRLSKRTYYREKNELINVVAECLGIGGDKKG